MTNKIYCVSIYQESDDGQIHDNDSYYFNSQKDADTFANKMKEYGKKLLANEVYVDFDVCVYEVKPKSLDEQLKETCEWYDDMF